MIETLSTFIMFIDCLCYLKAACGSLPGFMWLLRSYIMLCCVSPLSHCPKKPYVNPLTPDINRLHLRSALMWRHTRVNWLISAMTEATKARHKTKVQNTPPPNGARQNSRPYYFLSAPPPRRRQARRCPAALHATVLFHVAARHVPPKRRFFLLFIFSSAPETTIFLLTLCVVCVCVCVCVWVSEEGIGGMFMCACVYDVALCSNTVKHLALSL